MGMRDSFVIRTMRKEENNLVQRGGLGALPSLAKAEGWGRKKSQPMSGQVGLGCESGNGGRVW